MEKQNKLIFNMLSRLTNYLILLFLFALPFQTRWIIEYGILNNRPWEFGTISLYGTEFFLWLIVILTGIRIFGRPDFWKSFSNCRINADYFKMHKKNILAVLIFLFSTAVFIRSGNPISWQFTTWFLGGICLMISIAVSELSFSRAGMTLWLSGVVQGVLAVQQFFYQKIIGSKWLGMSAQNSSDSGVSVVQFGDERWLRAYGSFGWPNSLGIYLAVIFVLGLILYFYFSKTKWRILILVGQLIILTGLLLSFSRGAWLAAVGGLLIFGLIAWNNLPFEFTRRKFYSQFVKQLAVYAVLVISLVTIYFPVFTNRFNTGNYLEYLSITERQDQLNVAGQMISDNLFFGVGPGLYTNYLARYFVSPTYGVYQPVHNIFLLALAELGIFVFLFILVFVFWLIKKIGRAGPIYFSVLTVLFLAGFYDHFLWSLYAGQLIWWVVLALGLMLKKSQSNIEK
ncbi:MAG: hypothetical protein COU29_00490 [Candidatus Magasanikbacteria bacterium CG10_big_fil_rev_8_21_14_0_10_36_32]|uniref:O-antigen ligase-related domain-containing protein n=1 Tax=Candidatus Magasanikbacteria bacterium CG10_big_fil_rev_8_21_14_0_10_36_32 TaxID=1974646 RepID=A0A2M6W7J9_9BACT|nr:MAG: hypothetical protein COU29_00490 [Candidatus Magasanikbacteria bacterium CG10_big_fil_rev_8_21_14_0_10_36_32]